MNTQELQTLIDGYEALTKGETGDAIAILADLIPDEYLDENWNIVHPIIEPDGIVLKNFYRPEIDAFIEVLDPLNVDSIQKHNAYNRLLIKVPQQEIVDALKSLSYLDNYEDKNSAAHDKLYDWAAERLFEFI